MNFWSGVKVSVFSVILLLVKFFALNFFYGDSY